MSSVQKSKGKCKSGGGRSLNSVRTAPVGSPKSYTSEENRRVTGSPACGEGVSLDNGSISGRLGHLEGSRRRYRRGERVIRADTGEIVSGRSGPSIVGDVAGFVSFGPNGVTVRRVRAGPDRVGAGSGSSRGIVRGMSRRSRNNLLNKLLRVDFGSFTGKKGRVRARGIFLTLTYPGDWEAAASLDSDVWKAHLKAFRKRMERLFSRIGVHSYAGIWKQEFQGRGAPHFHVALLLSRDIPVKKFERWAARAFADIVSRSVGRGFPHHARRGAQAVGMYGEADGLMRYLSKYLCKRVDDGDLPAELQENGTGRVWGMWCEENLPVGAVTQVAIYGEGDWWRMIGRIRSKGADGRSWFLAQFTEGRVYGDGGDLFWELLGGLVVRVLKDGGIDYARGPTHNVLQVPLVE